MITQLLKDWQDAAQVLFKDSTSISSLNGAKREINEAIDAIKDSSISRSDMVMEYADILLYIADSLRRQGVGFNELAEHLQIKIEINKKRSWKQNKDNTYQHVNK